MTPPGDAPRNAITDARTRLVEDLTMGYVSRPNGGGLSWNENESKAVALVAEFEDRVRAATPAVPDAARHPGEPHDFRTTCLRCGERGLLHVALIGDDEVFRVENRAALDEGGQ